MPLLSCVSALLNLCAGALLVSSGSFLPSLFTSLEFANHDWQRNQWPFLCPFSLCCFSTVRAATSSARLPYRPDFFAASLMCSYWRCSLSPTPRTCLFPGILTSYVLRVLQFLSRTLYQQPAD